EAFAVGHRRERGHGFKAIHAIILINGIMDCKFHLLFLENVRPIFRGVRRTSMTETQTQLRNHYAFTPTVKAIQDRKGSRDSYQHMEERPWRATATPGLAAFIAAQTSFFFATATADGQPYIQHRGGPAGF